MTQSSPGPSLQPSAPGPQAPGQGLAGKEFPVCLQLVPLSVFLSSSTSCVCTFEGTSALLSTCSVFTPRSLFFVFTCVYPLSLWFLPPWLLHYFSFYHEVLKKNIGVCDLLHVDTVLKSIFTFIFNFLVFFILVAFRLCFYTFRLKNSIFHFCSVNIFLHYFHCLILTYLF